MGFGSRRVEVITQRTEDTTFTPKLPIVRGSLDPNNNSDSLVIADNEAPPPDPPNVWVEATDANALEAGSHGAETGEFTVYRDQGEGSLTVEFDLTGTATEGTDYESLTPHEVTFEDGQTKKIVVVTAIDDDLEEGSEDVILTLLEGVGYTIANPDSDTVTILEKGITSGPNKNADSHCSCDCGCKPITEVDIDSGQLGFNPLAAMGLPMPLFMPIYSSNENPHPITFVDVYLPESNLPNYYEAVLDFGGIIKTVDVDVPSGWTGGEVARLALQVDASTLPTGRYGYTVTLTPKFSDGMGGTTSGTPLVTSGGHEVFNRRDSAFGNRWWIPALDELQVDSGGASLIRGNGTAAWFGDDGNGGYKTPV